MENDNSVFELLNNGEIDEFLYQAIEIDNEGWNNLEIVRFMIDSLKIQNLGLRDFIYRIILNLDASLKPAAANIIIGYLYDTDKELRNLASDLLIKLGEYSNNGLLQLLSDEDVDVKKFASDILGFTGTDTEIPDLVMLLNDKDMNVFSSAIESIGAIIERNKDKIGLEDSILDLLFNVYKLDNSDTKPVIIESVSKVGGHKAVEFLINLLEEEEDLFIKTTIIDALAICGDSEYLCNTLMDDIFNYPKEIQPIVLKTLVAIAFRIDFPLKQSEQFREIARFSMTDSDPEVRTGGLLALGNIYNEEDIPFLVKEYLTSNDELRYYILSNFVNSFSTEIFDKFLSELMKVIKYTDSNFILFELNGYLENLLSDCDKQLIKTIMYCLLTNFIEFIKFEQFDIFENVNQINSQIFTELLKEMTENNPNTIYYQNLLNHITNIF